MATKLKNLALNEISLVDKGAAIGARVVIAKKDKGPMSKFEDLWKRWTSGEKIEVAKEIADPMKQLEELVGELPAEKQALFNALIAACMAQSGAPAPAPVAKPEPPKGDKPAEVKPADMAKILKAAGPETVEVLKALTDKVDVLAKALATELGKGRKADAIAKAETLKAIPGATTEAMAQVIERLGNEAPEIAGQVVEMLTKANAALAKKLPMAPQGTAAGAGGEALDGAKAELEALVQKRLSEVRKSGTRGRYTYEQAYMDTLTENPALVAKLSEERQD